MSTTNAFASVPRIGIARITAAETSFTAPAVVVSAFISGAGGSRIQRIDINALMTTTAGMVNLFWYDGTSYRLFKSVDVDAIIVAAGTPPFQISLIFPEGIPVPSSSGGTLFDELVAATYTGDDFDVIVYGGDL
jgi:hypothetical protein